MTTHIQQEESVSPLIKVFEQLELESRASTLYIHCSLNNLKAFCSARSIFEALDLYFDKNSNLCMPAFPYSDKQFTTYIENPDVFDVRRTPARVCLLSEVFRRKQGTERSIHPWASVCASGKDARDIVSEHHLHKDTFSKRSPFSKIVELNGYVLGLGLDCNTNSFIHLPDNELQHYASNSEFKKYYTDKDFKCIDHEGKLFAIQCNVINQTIRSKIKPRIMKPVYLDTEFYREVSVDNVSFYAIKLKPFIRYTINENKAAVSKALWPSHFSG